MDGVDIQRADLVVADPYRTDSHLFTLSLEAASLFALLVHVDHALWKELARKVWPRALEWADFIETRESLFVGVEVYRQRGRQRVDGQVLGKAVVEWLNTPRSRQYTVARDHMARIMGVDQVFSLLLNIEDTGSSTSKLLSDIRSILALQPSTSPRVTHVKLRTAGVVVNEGAIRTMVAIRALGVQFTNLPKVSINQSRRNASQAIDMIRELLDVADATDTVQDSSTNIQSHGVEKVAVSSQMVRDLISSVYSAIHASRSLRAVEIKLEGSKDGDTRQLMVMWMAYALFCRQSLEAVAISVASLRMKDVRWMAHVTMPRVPLIVTLNPYESQSPISLQSNPPAFFYRNGYLPVMPLPTRNEALAL